ncbi:MAG: S1 RNA-binding domain-containing protein [Cyanobacteria bacterium P01_H01_bin.74]
MVLSTLPEISDEVRQTFESLLQKSFESDLKPGIITLGEILSIEKDGLMVDIGGKSEGFVPMKEIQDCSNADDLKSTYYVNQVTEFYILNEYDNNDKARAHYTLSLRRVAIWKNWDRLLEEKAQNKIVEATVTATTKGGVIVSVLGFKGFIPASQLRVAKMLSELVGENLPAKILEIDKLKNKLILSHREAIFEQKANARKETLEQLNQGDEVDGAIVKITDFGVFIDINGIDGLLPLSEITWRRIQHPSEVLTLGDKLKVTVLAVDRKLQRISLSLKRMQEDPWKTVKQNYQIGQEVDGRVSKLLNSGVLAELTPGIEAYCAFDQTGREYHMKESYRFRIVSIYAHDRRITLTYQGEADNAEVVS